MLNLLLFCIKQVLTSSTTPRLRLAEVLLRRTKAGFGLASAWQSPLRKQRWLAVCTKPHTGVVIETKTQRSLRGLYKSLIQWKNKKNKDVRKDTDVQRDADVQKDANVRRDAGVLFVGGKWPAGIGIGTGLFS